MIYGRDRKALVKCWEKSIVEKPVDRKIQDKRQHNEKEKMFICSNSCFEKNRAVSNAVEFRATAEPKWTNKTPKVSRILLSIEKPNQS